MPDPAAVRAVQALGLTPREIRRQVRRWSKPEPKALAAAYYRDLARWQRALNAQLLARLRAGADPDALAPAIAAAAERVAGVIRPHGLEVLRRSARKYGTPLGVALGLSGSFLTGVRTDALDPDLENQVLESWTRENVALIKGSNAQQIERIQALVLRSARDGTRAADIQRQIAEIMASNVRRGRLIARDQIGKLSGQLDRLKQTRAGIEAYTWRTVGDERVRGKHRALNGTTHRWDDPPAEGHPGQPVQCRCTAEADLVALLGEEFAV